MQITPELYCSNFQKSLTFYTKHLGFSITYTREQERFAFLDREGAQLMIEQTVEADRQWVLGELTHPYGRGINLQISTTNIVELYESCQSAGLTIFLPLEEKLYQVGPQVKRQRQFIVVDPDGYLLRFCE